MSPGSASGHGWPEADPGLTAQVAASTRRAVEDLHARHPGPFCVYALLTTGEALRPYLTVTRHGPDRWDLADSPFAVVGEEHLARLAPAFTARGDLTALAPAAARAEYRVRLASMEAALHALDDDGLFGRGPVRDGVLLLVSPMPPDASDAPDARRLNPAGPLLDEWLTEAAEGGPP